MLDIKIIRENPEIVKNDLRKRQELDKIKWVDELLEFDKKRRNTIAELNELRKKRNEITEEIAKLKKKGGNVDKLLKQVKEIPEKINKLEEDLSKYEEKVNWYLLRLPNILHESVPYGKDDKDNVVIKVWGKPPEFDFQPKNHLEILEGLGLIDLQRAAKVAGNGFYYLKEDVVLLDLAIQRFAIDHLRKKGFKLVLPPYMLRKDAYMGVTDLDAFHDVLYKIEDEDLYMIATAEHPLGSMFKDEVFSKKELPLKLVGISPCFRKEVGSHGKYTKGLFRVHQFHKIEQFVFCLPEQSWEIHEEIQQNSEELYQSLGIHYRVVNVCTGDIGSIAAKKYDTEFWMADGQFREIGSNSNCTDYQARRLNIKYREKDGQAPIGFVHTLNNTALATSRTMIAIIEQFQQKDGTVVIPKVLRKYMDGKEVLEKVTN
ncbi:MAG: serine--tRNA ligase [Candidatus Aenigmatarchaeota archaeon]|nr:serine--tRNA ligase [Candidatus Aenigmarchaeota archaeon]